ncbi:MAG: peptide deformylase [bacterium]|nr:peptide deformylase [bacterium]
MSVRPIRLYPDPVLRVDCSEVTAFAQDLRKLAEDMVETMHAAIGVGLAAPQIGVEKRLVVVDATGGEDPDAELILVNPVLSNETGTDHLAEGCLSIPGFTEKVDRPLEVHVRAQNLEGETIEFDAEDLLARVICHEIDHLNGVLFVDHLTGLRKEKAKRHLRRLREEEALVL